MMVVVHEMIPHHHHDMDDIELFSHQHHSNEQDNNSEHGTTDHFPIPAHHHVLASEGFNVARIGTSLEKDLILPLCFFISHHLLSISDTEAPENTYYSDFAVHLSSLPFIISPNAMRGSPSIA